MRKFKLIPVNGLMPPPLSDSEIHYYLFTFDELSRHTTELSALLSAEEEERARRFLNPRHGDHFRLARGTLRYLLAQYCQTEAGTLAFDYNDYGKPFLSQSVHFPISELQFNVSHTKSLCAYGFARSARVGIDVEQYRELNNRDDLQERICTDREISTIQALDADRAENQFYRIWCRKEAFIKAYGRGLSMGLSTIDVLEDSISYTDDKNITSQWQIRDLETMHECGFACAYEIRTS